MAKSDLLKLVVIFLILETVKAKSYIEEYSWKDYEGTVPADALATGLDRSGRTVYIGQVLYENKLIPGKIYSNDKNVYFEWYDKEVATNQNVKILCSEQAQKFEWIQTRHNEVVHLTNKLLIKGGFEPGYSTYIGRVFTNGETLVGKVICSTDDCFGLYTTSNGAGQLHQDFQVLTYNPLVESVGVNCNDKLIGKSVLGSYMFARGRALTHWNTAVANPMEPLQQWHTLCE